MKYFALPILTVALLGSACGSNSSGASPAGTDAVDANQTEAVYGDEAPVAIAADAAHPHEDEHAHNEDGSHAAGSDDHDGERAHGDDSGHNH